ncbi:hypothetical protein HZH66_011384 [Vespula vulgaris]|uniref:Syntrophin C-terminal PH domain-containing protein n=1 Tax=Vespula vulgaris TaxID=7454 RepID=A0A834JFL1_VESVU|nr:hypothetical protein HZH66_011384 [Vespula vulgaris]
MYPYNVAINHVDRISHFNSTHARTSVRSLPPTQPPPSTPPSPQSQFPLSANFSFAALHRRRYRILLNLLFGLKRVMKKRDGVWNGDSGGEGSEGGGKRLVEEHSPTGLLKCYRILECRGMETSEAFPRMFRTARLVSSPTRQNEAAASSSGGLTQHGATFAVRVGTIDGVVTHHLRAETRRDLAAWARAIVQGCHAAAASLREYTVRCTWQGKACQLVVNHEEGFSLYATGTRGVVGNGVSPGSPPTPLWKRSFDKLKMSADDGARLLWLDFGGEDGEFELDLESCPKPIVFVLHNFLSAKIHRMGLSA